MSKRKKNSKPVQATVLLTGEDAINLNLGVSLKYHLPFNCLKHYYSGGIHRPGNKVGSPKENQAVGHELYPNVGMFCKPDSREEEIRPDSWLSDGVWIGTSHYDPRDVLGAHIQTADGQELVFRSVESVNNQRPFANAIRNFTKTVKKFRPPIQAEHVTARVHSWRQKVDHNLQFMEHSWAEAETPENVIYAGSGPSLRHNWHELAKLDFSKTNIWAANQAFEFLTKRNIPVDYFFCMDATAYAEWWKEIDCSETCLVASPFVNPEILKAGWKRVYWYNIAADGFYFNKVRQARPHLLEIDGHLGVGSAIIESAWPKKAKRMVMVGCDFCYEVHPESKEIWRSAGWKLNEDEWRKLSQSHAHYLVYNHKGESVPTYFGLAFEASAVFAAAQCLWEQGIEVINATEGGILRPNPSARYLRKLEADKGKPILPWMTLKNAVEKLNA